MSRNEELGVATRKRTRFGIAEWYGRKLDHLLPSERLQFASELLDDLGTREQRLCPFKPGDGGLCGKPSGVCSIRGYTETVSEGERVVAVAEGADGSVRATCPNRFHEGGSVYSWAGEVLLGNDSPQIVPEVGFLEPVGQAPGTRRREVGRIDLVLMNPPDLAGRVDWAALEIQAVYFSGKGMKDDFVSIAKSSNEFPFPQHVRRPDYRSSGPKRLLPQLQTKVPTLSRWGKRMAVVVDRPFFEALDPMQFVPDLSSADIAWFVVEFEDSVGSERISIKPNKVYFTTLSEAVSGLTGGRPTTEQKFLERLLAKAARKMPLDLVDEEDLGGKLE